MFSHHTALDLARHEHRERLDRSARERRGRQTRGVRRILERRTPRHPTRPGDVLGAEG